MVAFLYRYIFRGWWIVIVGGALTVLFCSSCNRGNFGSDRQIKAEAARAIHEQTANADATIRRHTVVKPFWKPRAR